MATITAVVALLISLASFAFNIYQYRIPNEVRVGEKASNLLRFVYDLRRRSEDLKLEIGHTDDVPDCGELFAKINPLLEAGITSLSTTSTIGVRSGNAPNFTSFLRNGLLPDLTP